MHRWKMNDNVKNEQDMYYFEWLTKEQKKQWTNKPKNKKRECLSLIMTEIKYLFEHKH